jgi:hypothetical protein
MATDKDLVLVYFEDKPLVFARIESIIADSKPNWYHVKLLLLQVPPQLVTWILRDVYIDGAEFTMNGKRMRMEAVIVPEETQDAELQEEQDTTETPAKETDSNAKVISFTDLKKK